MKRKNERKKHRNVRPLGKFDYSLIGAVVLSIVAVIIINFIGSYGHISAEGLRYGEYGIDDDLMPVGIDGMLLALALTNVFATMHGRSHWLLRTALGFGVAGTIAANGAYGAGWGVTGGLLATWSPVALFITVEAGLFAFRIMNDIASATAKPKRGRPVGSAASATRAPRMPKNAAYQGRAEVAIPTLVGRVEPVDVLNPFEDMGEVA